MIEKPGQDPLDPRPRAGRPGWAMIRPAEGLRGGVAVVRRPGRRGCPRLRRASSLCDPSAWFTITTLSGLFSSHGERRNQAAGGKLNQPAFAQSASTELVRPGWGRLSLWAAELMPASGSREFGPPHDFPAIPGW